MKRWLLLAVVVVAVLAAGCDSNRDADRARLQASVDALMSGWATQSQLQLERFISNDYAFDEQNKADHVAAIVADFPDMRNFRLTREQLAIISPNVASVQVEFTVQLLADVASLDETLPNLEWVPSDNVLDQVWVKDFDGVWRLAAEYLQRSWVLNNTPNIDSLSVLPGDRIAPGDTGAFTAHALAGNNSVRVTLFPNSDAAASFNPTFDFGFGSADYSGDVTVRTDAFGEYSFSITGQSDIPGQPRMLGRTLRAVYIIVSTRGGRAIIGGKVVPGNRQSIFRRVRIHRAAGRYREPRPGPAK